MVAIAPFSVAAVFTIICLIGIWYCLTFGLRPFLQQVIGPVSSIWPDAGAAIDNAVNALANWALNWLNQLMDQAYQWIQIPASNAITLLNKMSDFGYSITNALIRLHNRIGAAESNIGAWTSTSNITDTINRIASSAASNAIDIYNLGGTVATIINGTATVIGNIYTAIGTAASGALSSAETYTDTSATSIYTLISTDVATLDTSIGAVSSYAQGVETSAETLAANAICTAEDYTNSAINALEQSLVGYINTSVGSVRTDLVDAISGVTTTLQGSISGVSTELKGEVATLAAALAADDTALSGEIKTQISTLAGQIAQTTGALSTEIKTDYATVTAAIASQATTLANKLTADVTSLSNTIVQSEGALNTQIQGDIASVAAAAQAARNALNTTLTAAIASVAVQAATTARTLAADEANCIQPTCDAFLPQVPSAKAILAAATTGIFLAIIDAAITDPQGTAALFQPATQVLAQPILNQVESLVPS